MLDNWLLERGFLRTLDVKGRKSIAKLFDESTSCGIYFLHFANDEYYVGLAKDVRRRFTQHCKTQSYIASISFKPVGIDELKRVESTEIEFFKSRVRLRNIDEMEDLIMERNFDKLVSPDFAALFLNDLEYNDLSGEKYYNNELQTKYKYRQCFQSLSQQAFYNDLLTISRIYTQHCIPAPLKTEYAYWSVSCFTIKSGSAIIRVNIYQQEVYTVYVEKDKNENIELDFVFHLAKSPLEAISGAKSNISIIRKHCPSVQFENFHYPTGGKDQLRLSILDSDILNLFLQPAFIAAARLHNLRLMRKGTNMNRVSHCMDLAESMLIPYDKDL